MRMLLKRHVLDGMAGQAADEDAVVGRDVVGDDVADVDAPGDAHRRIVRAAQPGAETDEDRRVHDVAHRDVRDGHVLHRAAVHLFERKPAAIIEHAVGNRDVLESAVGFGAELDAARRAAAASRRAFVRAVEQRAFLVTAHLAVHDGDVLRCAGVAEAEATLETDAVVAGRIDRAVGDAHVAAAVDVHAVAVGVDLEVVDREIVGRRSRAWRSGRRGRW